MSLVRYLPVPSDRMGIIWSLLNVQGSIVLEYGPAGTTHYSMGLYGGLGIRFQNRLFTTHLSEDDVVMGDVSRLEESIVELDKSYGPKVIFVVASSVTAVIGTDIKGVCRYMQQEVKARLIAFEQGGFRGDYSVGVSEAYKLLVRNFSLNNASRRQGTYNILGASAWHYRIASDVWEVKSLLKETFGLKSWAVLCCDTSVDELEQLGEAQINIVLSCEGLAAAQLLERQFGTPYVYVAPYGYQGTQRFLEQVGQALGREPEPLVMMRLAMKQKGMSMLGMVRMMSGNNFVPKALLKGEYDTIVGVSDFLAEAGIEVEHKICAHSLKSVAEPRSDVEYFAQERQWLEILRQQRNSLVLADDVALGQCDDSNTKLRLSSPYLKGAQIATHLPFMGEKGADYLLEYINAYYQQG
ncbi:MAG: nitrogenase component 1 [Phascolarctobacterium sp.]